MFLFIPYSTDTPLYHWPFASGGLILTNIAVTVYVYSLVFGADPEQLDAFLQTWCLTYGKGLFPWQWITSNFVHAGIFHLLGNMIWLWSFGLIVEGKLGWWKFLLVYLGIGVVQCAVEQTITLGFDGGFSLGASSIIFGLIAISMVWAPKNELSCLLVIMIFYFIRTVTIEVGILTMAFIAIASQVLYGIISTSLDSESFMSTEILHLMGAAVGFGVGVVMLRRGWVDCEGWDMFTLYGKRKDEISKQTKAHAKASGKEKLEKQEQLQSQQEYLLEQIRDQMKSGQPKVAYKTHLRATQLWSEWRLPETDFIQLISAYHDYKLWSESIPVMRQFLSHNSSRAPLVRLRLAMVLLQYEDRPGQALKVLSKINPQLLSPEIEKQWKTLYERAKAGAAENPYEVMEEGC